MKLYKRVKKFVMQRVLHKQPQQHEGILGPGLAMPLIRPVFPASLLSQLVSVQPMGAPAGKYFYLDYKFDGCNSMEWDELTEYDRIHLIAEYINDRKRK